MTEYSPFWKELNALETDDLAVLREVSEGWYVEYKREIPNASSIAKSVCAFGNTYGGWVFYGVEEKSKEDAVAGRFPGIPKMDTDTGLQRIRQAVAGSINPSPHFDTKVLWGPCEAIGLAEDHAVICIKIPWSPTAPHLHKSGQIYRRVADGSEPKPEADRYVLDQLSSRSKGIEKFYRYWVGKDPEFSKSESEIPYLRILLTADRWGERTPWADVSLERMRKIMSGAESVLSSIPFDTVHQSGAGFLARQLIGNDPHHLGLTWHFLPTLDSEIIIPLKFHTPSLGQNIQSQLHGYDFISRYAEILLRGGHKSPRIVDLNFLFNALTGIVEIQRKLLQSAEWTDSYFAKTKLMNAWRTIPFIDIESIISDFEIHGIPMCLESKIISPPGTSPSTFVEISQFPDIEVESVSILLQTFRIFGPIARIYGVPEWKETSSENKSLSYYEELLAAGKRSIDVQSRQKENLRNV